MKIIVDGKQAVLKAGSSFEYHSENPLFTDAEDYSMDIEFPMKDCPQNIAIFGALHVKGVDLPSVTYDCKIVADGFVKSGILTITAVSDTEVKGQFLEGMSRQNFASDLPETLLTDLDFSAYDGSDGTAESLNRLAGAGWVDMTIYDTNAGKAVFPSYTNGSHSSYNRRIYLYHLVDLISAVSGWNFNQDYLKTIPFYTNIVVANGRHYTSDADTKDVVRPLNFSLPRWTLKEFAEQMGKFFNCIPVVDGDGLNVKFVPYKDVSDLTAVERLDVLDSFTVEMVSERESGFVKEKKYKLPDESICENLNVCPWLNTDDKRFYFFKSLDPYYESEYDVSLAWLAQKEADPSTPSPQPPEGTQLSGERHFRVPGQYMVYTYVYDNKRYYFVVTGEDKVDSSGESVDAQWAHHFLRFALLNQYGDLSEGEELKIAPCPIDIRQVDDTRIYYDPLLPYHPVVVLIMPHVAVPDDFPTGTGGKFAVEALSSGELKADELYFDKLWLVIKSSDSFDGTDINTLEFEPDFTYVGLNDKPFYYHKGFRHFPYTLSPTNPYISAFAALPDVDTSKLYRYSFLSRRLPDVKHVFIISGKRYLCQRLTAHFTVSGMSELIEGEFYEIIT